MVRERRHKLEEVTHYYPFGDVYGDAGLNASAQPYKYNGKELDRMYRLDWYDYGARDYDAVVPMWTSVDPLCEKYYNVSPYVYCVNNPMNAVDPDGEKTVFVNGYKIFGSPSGGDIYWGGRNSPFVLGAERFFKDKNTFFTDVDYSYISSSTLLRTIAGYNYAKNNYKSLISGMNKNKDNFHFVSHSMGAAFSEGIINYLTEEGWHVDFAIHFNAWSPTEIYGKKGVIRIDATITNDPVQFFSLPISGNNYIPNADLKYRKKSEEGLFYRHRDLIDNDKSWNSIIGIIANWLKCNPNIHIHYGK